MKSSKQLVIPLGPRFQASVPEWTGPPQRRYPHNTINNLDSSNWSGTVIWSNNHRSPEAANDVIGRGRSHRCDCYNPGSILCVKSHINEKTARLHNDLGPAFQIWKFNEMGEVVAKLWKQSEQQKFARIVKTNPNLEGNNFIKIALESFPSKSANTIVSYYFNVYLPRQLSIKTRSGCTLVDTDNEEEEKTTPCSKGSQKRAQVDGAGPASKIMKVGYLIGQR
uniref:AT-rich interactive domain-containing protein 1-like isoform X2 n=1 Tax=Erigeron canadensis TaxID=72917 RepID=UPI001CB91AB9|nr:AT-rich interactive domain-containing protein 1-like isoform X2 [Erigeron canadensis]